jgi:adenylate cyclase class IV
MARNVEIKVRVESLDAVHQRAAALSGAALELIEQDDVFYAVASGRLKLRRFADGSAELIHYERPDGSGARLSDYERVAVGEAAEALHRVLVRGLGVRARVRKQRWLARVGRSRLHLDRVEGLGDFVEIEVVLEDTECEADGRQVAEQLLAALGLAEAPRLATAYADLQPPRG